VVARLEIVALGIISSLGGRTVAYRWIEAVCIFVLVMCGLPRRGMAADTADSPFVYVCRDAGAGGYQAFPDVARLQDGRLMAAFYNGYGHISLPNAQWPQGGRICYCFSDDEGHSWSQPKVLYDGPNDDRETSIFQAKSGQIICNFYILRRGTEQEEVRDVGLGVSIIVSDDLGKTWSEPRQIYDAPYYCETPIRELSNGRLVMGLYYETPVTGFGAVGTSDDGGKTWNKAVDIPSGGQRLDAETDVIELKDGTLYAAQRAAMCSSVSKDRGNTWSVSKPIGFAGHCPYLHRTSDGIIILGYRRPGVKFDESSTSLRYSLDECQTWSDEVLIDKVCGAYPSMVNLKDGSVLIVYYEEGAKSAIRAKRCRVTRTSVEWLSP
jgi:sialidase-1